MEEGREREGGIGREGREGGRVCLYVARQQKNMR